eukprot:COSAG03_NODE_9953_length_682_cov_1.214408_2_plen_95_part_01
MVRTVLCGAGRVGGGWKVQSLAHGAAAWSWAAIWRCEVRASAHTPACFSHALCVARCVVSRGLSLLRLKLPSKALGNPRERINRRLPLCGRAYQC